MCCYGRCVVYNFGTLHVHVYSTYFASASDHCDAWSHSDHVVEASVLAVVLILPAAGGVPNRSTRETGAGT